MNANPIPQPGPPPGLPLHATWWQVLKPKPVVLPNGQPAYDIAGTCETIAEATNLVRDIPGGVIVMNCAVFVNPQSSPIIRPTPRPGAKP